jgi:hypothetical protein
MNTKLIVALAIIGVLAVTTVGVVSAQIATSTPNPNGTATNGAQNGGFFGRVGRCFGLNGSQHYGTGTPAYQGQPANITVTDPNTGQTATYQGYYGNGYGRCMRGFHP